jgi:glycosyltransferase involved in cell wall biosynthesis
VKCAILIPAHNEEKTIGSLIIQIKSLLPNVDVIVVNSNCTDNTPIIAKSCSAIVIKTDKPGYWNALCCGYEFIVKNNYQKIVQLDADGQHPTYVLPRMFNLLNQHDWIIGSRYKTGSYRSKKTKLAQKYLTYFVQYKFQLYCTDISSGMWGMNLSTIKRLIQYKGKTADAAIRAYGHNTGISIFETPVPMKQRKTGKSMHDGLSSLLNFIRTINDIYSHTSDGTTAESKSASLSI